MARNRELIGSVLLASGIIFTVAGAVALIAGQAVLGIVLLAIGLSDIVLRFVLARLSGRPAASAQVGGEGGAATEASGVSEPRAGGESTDPSYNPYARED